jgi:transcriptional regulator with XRE-family HTH domain
MNRTMELLEAVKKRQGISSDYALAGFMGVTRAQISKYRCDRESLSDEKALWVADLLGLDAGYVLAMMNAERADRAQNTAAATAWEKVVDRLKTLGPVALLFLAAGPAVGMVSSGARLLGEAVCILCQIRPVPSRRTWCNNPGDAFAAPA